ncbi:MAG: 4-(cytidine 5'-diphospho)-2-C-methyl-D-erythritol kinase [Mariprofundaceae bacterium]|nr:4-(cytidine 5'-diphospho)-2-C-methyl-D-erythritol kinase [Mariprofundaceae bacterium]
MKADTYLAPAKVNLHLRITDVLENGYHALDTSFVYVDVWDVLHIVEADDLIVGCSEAALTGKKNLVYQVLAAFRALHGVRQGLSVFIEKNLPSQAGLGGGSSDAATALMVANQLWGIDASSQALIAFAAPYGADIPCFLFQQASLATGIGEKLLPYGQPIPDGKVVLAWPGEGVSTAAAFEHFDAHVFYALTDEKVVAKVRARSGGDALEIGLNSLEQSATALCAPLASLLSAMRDKVEHVWMSGSGSACVAVCQTSEQAVALADELQQQKLASWTHIGHFLPKHPWQTKV